MVKGRPKYWFTSDTHFGHAMVAGLREFWNPIDLGPDTPPDVIEHDLALIRNWNSVVGPDDIVFHLGDVGLGGNDDYILDCVGRLNGHKQLITGNHDKCWPARPNAYKKQAQWLTVFESVQQYGVVRLGYGGDVLLSHFPYTGDHTELDRDTQWRLPDQGGWLLHGHLHVPDRVTAPKSIHVGLDAWSLRPVSEHEIVALMKDSDEMLGRAS